LFLQMDGGVAASQVYAEATDLILAAEGLGYHSARVTQHHFGERYGQLSAPLPFLVAVGQQARRIHLGTVVVTIPTEHPLRLAEDAAVSDLLLDGRLELGLGSGLNKEVFATFEVDFDNRRTTTQLGIEQLQQALQGTALDEQGRRLQPCAPGLASRLWLGAMSDESTYFAAQHNLGLLLGRVEQGGGSPVANQAHTAQFYRQTLAPQALPARIVVGRTIYPAADRATAIRDLAEALQPLVESYVRSGFIPAGTSFPDILTRLHIIHGHPEEIVQTLLSEQAEIGWTELLVQVDPGDLPHAKALRAIERIAQEIVPHLQVGTPQLTQVAS
jgi:alkanesulfonate monooxygenase SsuD/methylene tetrahydromethanopterin reductase-like flavin-dependent oxidoreductase (luciferase family)